ncbi:hypothetical protein [Sulfurovum sp.]|uniref:hypothetical protein n=1 Tax=Sulfurovum sp. TaxID=1969726 RepID=UPI0035638B5C
MNNVINKVLYFALLLPALLFATATQESTSTTATDEDALAIFYTIDGDAQEKYNMFVEKKLKSIGFQLTDPHKRVNDQYETKYGSTVLDVLSFMPVVNDEVILPLLNIDPRIAGFAPFNMLIYKKLDENVTHVGHLMPKIMLEILDIENKEVREKFTATFKSLNGLIEQELGGQKSYMPYKKLPEKRMINFEYEFEAPDDIDDFIGEFQNRFELAFIDKGYLIAGYHNFMEATDDAEDILSDYDAFWTYSLCHLKFSYNMFDNEGARPEAGMFAPCTMYMYIKKGTNKVVVGMYRLHNWSDTLDITDKARLVLVEQLDREIPEILTEFGMKAVSNVNPLTHTPKVLSVLASNAEKSTTVTKKVSKKVEQTIIQDVPVPENALAVMYTLEGNIEKTYNTIVDEELKTIGYEVTDPHYRVNDQYEDKYGSTILDTLSFLSVVNDKEILPLLNIDPRIASTAPFNMLIYKKLDENVTHVGHIMPTAFLDMIGIEDQKVRDTFVASIKPLDEKVEAEFRAKGLKYTKSYSSYKKLPENRMHNFKYEFDAPEDLDEFIEKFQNRFELAFIDKGYLIAGYHNFMEGQDDAEEILAGYDAFWTYSLCHLEFSYNMFDNEGAHPEAGLFAPCTMYVYIKKGTNKLVVGMLRLENWSTTLNISDEKRVGLVNKLDKEIPEVLTAFGMKATSNTNTLLQPAICKTETKEIQVKVKENIPEVQTAKTTLDPITKEEKVQTIQTTSGNVEICIPTVPKVPKAVFSDKNKDTLDRSIKFSKRMPPNYIPNRFDKQKKMKQSSNTRIGEVSQGRISAHLRGEFMDVKTVEENLKAAGFEVLTSVPVDKKGTLISVVFTDKSLLSMASKANRGFIASLRVLVDTKEKKISITNPLYMAKGFLQTDFDEKSAKKVLVKLLEKFPGLKNSKDVLKFQLLPKYQFMNGMPHYEDMIEVASGDDLLEKIKDNDKVLFTQTLENGSTLIGIQLSKRTSTFTKRIGRNNAGMLPYPILIENGKAKILDPKYYIAYMYPMLKMTEFMTIASIPDAMIKDCEKVFKKKKKK